MFCWPGPAAIVFRGTSVQVYEIRDLRGVRRSIRTSRRLCGSHAGEAKLEIRYRKGPRVAVDPLDQAGEHVARSELEERRCAGGDHILDRAGPIHRTLD